MRASSCSLLGAVAMVACSASGSSPVTDATVMADASVPDALVAPDARLVFGCPPDVVTVLRGGTYVHASGEAFDYQLLRLTDGCGHNVYAQWFPPRSGTRRPAVMIARPYAGIDWTGEEVDMRWAALVRASPSPDGRYPDVDGPNYGPGAQGVAYLPSTPDSIGDGSLIFGLHDWGVLHVFGRFYAGGDAREDLSDMMAAVRFLATEPAVDVDRVGITGGSWGGFEALHAAARSPGVLVPAACVAIAPVADLERELRYIQTDLPLVVTVPAKLETFQSFFEPYERRIEATTGGRPGAPGSDFGDWNAASIAAALRTPTLLIHDSWDTLVPYAVSEGLARDSALIEGVWLLHDTPPNYDTLPLDHGPLMAAVDYPVIYTFQLAYLFTRIGFVTDVLTVLVDPAAFRVFLEYARALQLSGADAGWLAPRLIDLSDPRLSTFELPAGTAGPAGAAFVATEVNAVWGTTYTAANVAAGLALGLPPP